MNDRRDSREGDDVKESDNLLVWRYVRGQLDKDEVLAVESRMASDVSFRDAVRAATRFDQMLSQTLPLSEQSEDEFEEMVLSAMDQEHPFATAAPTEAPKVVRFPWRRVRNTVLAAAAVLAVVVMLPSTFVRDRGGGRSKPVGDRRHYDIAWGKRTFSVAPHDPARPPHPYTPKQLNAMSVAIEIAVDTAYGELDARGIRPVLQTVITVYQDGRLSVTTTLYDWMPLMEKDQMVELTSWTRAFDNMDILKTEATAFGKRVAAELVAKLKEDAR
jgi:hypothetical protein